MGGEDWGASDRQKYPKGSRNICDHPFYPPYIYYIIHLAPLNLYSIRLSLSLSQQNKTHIDILSLSLILSVVGEMDVSGSFSSSADSNGSGQEPHVLAVDDSLVDRKIVERLLKAFSCRGFYQTLFFFPFFSHLICTHSDAMY